MKFFMLYMLGDLKNRELCQLSRLPHGMGLKWLRLANGTSAKEYYPQDATIHMSTDEGYGIKLSSFIGHVSGILVLHKDVIDVIKEYAVNADIEYFPFNLINPKGRVHSSDYFIVNPLGSVDCLCHKRSKFKTKGGVIRGVEHFVFDVSKTDNLPPIFRVKEELDNYFFRQDLVHAFEAKGFTNFVFNEVEVK